MERPCHCGAGETSGATLHRRASRERPGRTDRRAARDALPPVSRPLALRYEPRGWREINPTPACSSESGLATTGSDGEGCSSAVRCGEEHPGRQRLPTEAESPAAPVPRRGGASETMRRTCPSTAGSVATQAARHTPWGRKRQARGDSTTCTATCPSGVMTVRAPTRRRLRWILPAIITFLAWNAAAPGPKWQSGAALRTGTPRCRTTGTGTVVSASSLPRPPP